MSWNSISNSGHLRIGYTFNEYSPESMLNRISIALNKNYSVLMIWSKGYRVLIRAFLQKGKLFSYINFFVSGEIYESAQFLYMLVAACLFANYPKATRLDYVRRFYDACSTFKLSLPTPIMSGVRTPTRQFSSCVLIECGDSLDSINATSSAIP